MKWNEFDTALTMYSAAYWIVGSLWPQHPGFAALAVTAAILIGVWVRCAARSAYRTREIHYKEMTDAEVQEILRRYDTTRRVLHSCGSMHE